MEKRQTWLRAMSLFVFTMLLICSRAYADDTSRFNDQVLAIQADRAKMESQLDIQDTYRPVSLFYVGIMGHYEVKQHEVADAVASVIRFYAQVIKPVQVDRTKVFEKLGIEMIDTYPHASSYYDDLADHYEQGQLMADVISEGIR